MSSATVAAMPSSPSEIRRALPDRVRARDQRAPQRPAGGGRDRGRGGPAFVRINVHVGAMVTDQGLIEGDARATLLERTARGTGADRGRRAGEARRAAGARTLEDAARDTVHRGLADVVVDHRRRHRPTDRPRGVRRASRGAGLPGVGRQRPRPDTVGGFPPFAGAMSATWLHRDGRIDAPLDPARVKAMQGRARRVTPDHAANSGELGCRSALPTPSGSRAGVRRVTIAHRSARRAPAPGARPLLPALPPPPAIRRSPAGTARPPSPPTATEPDDTALRHRPGTAAPRPSRAAAARPRGPPTQ